MPVRRATQGDLEASVVLLRSALAQTLDALGALHRTHQDRIRWGAAGVPVETSVLALRSGAQKLLDAHGGQPDAGELLAILGRGTVEAAHAAIPRARKA